jgi:cytochrome c
MFGQLDWMRPLRKTALVRWSALPCFMAALTTFFSPTLAQKADLEFGRYLATECLTCHHQSVTSGAIPNIFGLEEATLTTLLKAYRDKQLPNPVMQSVAGRLKDDEIAALAHFFAMTMKP